jgi:hypothetical protein
LLRLRLTPILGVREHLTLLQLCLFPWAWVSELGNSFQEYIFFLNDVSLVCADCVDWWLRWWLCCWPLQLVYLRIQFSTKNATNLRITNISTSPPPPPLPHSVMFCDVSGVWWCFMMFRFSFVILSCEIFRCVQSSNLELFVRFQAILIELA